MLQSKSSSDDNTALTHYATISVMGKVLWHVDEHGYLYTPAGQRVARIDRDGHFVRRNMPYEIRKHNERWCVYKEGDDEAIACHDTEAEAEAQLRALYAAENKAKAKRITKTEEDGEHPADHYLVVEDPEKPSTWHLRVKDVNGKPDHRLMGAAWAALHEGYRGNRYEGPQKAEAIRKLKLLYEQEEMPLPGKAVDADEVLVNVGGAVKALGDGRIGGYLVLFGDPDHPDQSAWRDFFTPDTDFALDEDGTGTSTVYYQHGHDPQLGMRKLGKAQLRKDDVGVWMETQLRLRDQYERAIYALASSGKLGLSSGTAAHLVVREPQPNGTHHIRHWPLGLDASLTPIPAEPRTRVMPLKSLLDSTQPVALADLLAEAAAEAAAKSVPTAPTAPESLTAGDNHNQTNGDDTMDANELKSVVESVVGPLAQELNGLKAQLGNLEAALPRNDPGYKAPAEPKSHEPLYRGLGEFLLDVAKAAQGMVSGKLEAIKSKDPLNENGYDMAAALGSDFVKSLSAAALKATGLAESPGSAGGFLVGTDRAAALMERVYNVGEVLRRVDMVPVGPNSNGMTFYAEDETSRAAGSRRGGVQAYWVSEGGAKTASAPKFRQLELRLRKVAGLVYATDELLADAGALEAYVMRNLPEELRFVVEDAIINGTGAGMPLGILNSGAVVTVTKETSQPAATVKAENIFKMYSRMWTPSLPRAVWLISQDVWPQLYAMTIGSSPVPVYLPPNGMAGAPYGTLLNRPVIPVEYCAKLGTVGDVIFADLGEYQMIEKGGIQTASSIHVRFVYDETCFRFVYRVDGAPKWNSPLTPKNAGPTLSPFVVLETRS